MNSVQVFRWLSLFSYFALMGTLLCWITLAPHSKTYPAFALLLIGVVPLLLPIRGLLHGKPYTHAWASFLLLAYFVHGIGELYSQTIFSLYPILEVVFSCMCFIACIFYVKFDAKVRKISQN